MMEITYIVVTTLCFMRIVKIPSVPGIIYKKVAPTNNPPVIYDSMLVGHTKNTAIYARLSNANNMKNREDTSNNIWFLIRYSFVGGCTKSASSGSDASFVMVSYLLLDVLEE